MLIALLNYCLGVLGLDVFFQCYCYAINDVLLFCTLSAMLIIKLKTILCSIYFWTNSVAHISDLGSKTTSQVEHSRPMAVSVMAAKPRAGEFPSVSDHRPFSRTAPPHHRRDPMLRPLPAIEDRYRRATFRRPVRVRIFCNGDRHFKGKQVGTDDLH